MIQWKNVRSSYHGQNCRCLIQGTLSHGAVDPVVSEPVEDQPQQPPGHQDRQDSHQQLGVVLLVAPQLQLVILALVDNTAELLLTQTLANSDLVTEVGQRIPFLNRFLLGVGIDIRGFVSPIYNTKF